MEGEILSPGIINVVCSSEFLKKTGSVDFGEENANWKFKSSKVYDWCQGLRCRGDVSWLSIYRWFQNSSSFHKSRWSERIFPHTKLKFPSKKDISMIERDIFLFSSQKNLSDVCAIATFRCCCHADSQRFKFKLSPLSRSWKLV